MSSRCLERRIALATLALGLALGGAAIAHDVPVPTYTPAQVAAGGAVYRDRCAACHGEALEGLSGPPLRLAVEPADAEPVWLIHRTVAERMPKDRPGALDAASALAVTAFLLERNGIGRRGSALTADALRASGERYYDRTAPAPPSPPGRT